jgi:hypothetical protein
MEFFLWIFFTKHSKKFFKRKYFRHLQTNAEPRQKYRYIPHPKIIGTDVLKKENYSRYLCKGRVMCHGIFDLWFIIFTNE